MRDRISRLRAGALQTEGSPHGKVLKGFYRCLARLDVQTGICKNSLADFRQNFRYLSIADTLYPMDAPVYVMHNFAEIRNLGDAEGADSNRPFFTHWIPHRFIEKHQLGLWADLILWNAWANGD